MCRRIGSIELPLGQSCAVGTIGLLDAPDAGSEFDAAAHEERCTTLDDASREGRCTTVDDAGRRSRRASRRSSLAWFVVITQPELIAFRRPLSTDRGPRIALS